jgi:hypothetical protein
MNVIQLDATPSFILLASFFKQESEAYEIIILSFYCRAVCVPPPQSLLKILVDLYEIH